MMFFMPFCRTVEKIWRRIVFGGVMSLDEEKSSGPLTIAQLETLIQ